MAPKARASRGDNGNSVLEAEESEPQYPGKSYWRLYGGLGFSLGFIGIRFKQGAFDLKGDCIT